MKYVVPHKKCKIALFGTEIESPALQDLTAYLR